jgi:protein Mpv17
MNYLFKWYTNKLTKMPIRTKAITTCVIYGCGDLICQAIEKYYLPTASSLNLPRTIKQASFGLMIAPYFHLQFCIIIPYMFPLTNKLARVKAIVYDQTVATTIFHSLYFLYLDYLIGKTIVKEEIQDKVTTAVSRSWGYWPFVQFFNFSYIPSHFRVQFSNFFGIFWSAYISYVQNVKSKYLNI